MDWDGTTDGVNLGPSKRTELEKLSESLYPLCPWDAVVWPGYPYFFSSEGVTRKKLPRWLTTMSREYALLAGALSMNGVAEEEKDAECRRGSEAGNDTRVKRWRRRWGTKEGRGPKWRKVQCCVSKTVDSSGRTSRILLVATSKTTRTKTPLSTATETRKAERNKRKSVAWKMMFSWYESRISEMNFM